MDDSTLTMDLYISNTFSFLINYPQLRCLDHMSSTTHSRPFVLDSTFSTARHWLYVLDPSFSTPPFRLHVLDSMFSTTCSQLHNLDSTSSTPRSRLRILDFTSSTLCSWLHVLDSMFLTARPWLHNLNYTFSTSLIRFKSIADRPIGLLSIMSYIPGIYSYYIFFSYIYMWHQYGHVLLFRWGWTRFRAPT